MNKGKKPGRPVSKKVLALNEQLRRRRGERDLEKRYLIVCEDDRSARNYFEALKKYFNLSATSVQVVGSGGRSQPIQVVNEAITRKTNAAKPESGTEPFDEVWCAIDGDFGDKISNARAKATANGVKLAISTMCFEYWVLLHFVENDTAAPNCDAVVSQLKRRSLPEYDKGKCDFREVVPLVRDACQRSEKLRKPGIDRGELP